MPGWVTSCARVASTTAAPRPIGRSFDQTEVEQFGARVGHHDVAGLQVAVHEVVAVRAVEGAGDLDAARHGLLDR